MELEKDLNLVIFFLSCSLSDFDICIDILGTFRDSFLRICFLIEVSSDNLTFFLEEFDRWTEFFRLFSYIGGNC